MIGRFIGPRFATHCRGAWPRSFKSEWWTNYNQTFQYGRLFPDVTYTPRLENGGYRACNPPYFHYPKTGWKVPIHASYHEDFVYQLKHCFNQLGLDHQLIISQIIGMPDKVCLKLFNSLTLSIK